MRTAVKECILTVCVSASVCVCISVYQSRYRLCVREQYAPSRATPATAGPFRAEPLHGSAKFRPKVDIVSKTKRRLAGFVKCGGVGAHALATAIVR